MHLYGKKVAIKEGVDPILFQAKKYRLIGPSRGGRCPAVTGVPGQPYTFYMGTSRGGVLKSDDAGKTWINISDGFFECSSIGGITVAESDPNVIYVSTGEANLRGNRWRKNLLEDQRLSWEPS